MSEKLKDKLLLEIAQDLVLKFDTEISKDILILLINIFIIMMQWKNKLL